MIGRGLSECRKLLLLFLFSFCFVFFFRFFFYFLVLSVVVCCCCCFNLIRRDLIYFLGRLSWEYKGRCAFSGGHWCRCSPLF